MGRIMNMPKSTPELSVLFTPAKIGSLSTPNRFVRSATHEFMAGDDGTVTERLVSLNRALAEGEVGLIITGNACVHINGKAAPRQTGVSEDKFIEGLSLIPRAVHDFPSKIFIQLAHAGRQTKERICGCVPMGPSAVRDPSSNITPREMTGGDVAAAIEDFVQAARRAREAGFDGVQLHAAHGYLLSSFISPHTNRRTDEWGGTAERRVRIIVEIIRGIKGLAGRELPVVIKLNATDFLPTGLTLKESVEIARILEQAGVDGIEVSGGMSEAGKASMWPGLRSEDEEGYFIDSAAEIKKAVKIPVFGLGGNRTFEIMERFVRDGKVDFISLSRPFIREPLLVRKFRTGEIRKSECISCNKCFNVRGITCAQLRKIRPAS